MKTDGQRTSGTVEGSPLSGRPAEAIYLARAGQLERARKIVAEFRASQEFGCSFDDTFRAMLADALVSFFESQDFVGATDRLERAIALTSTVHGLSMSTIAELYAWLGHIRFNQCDYQRSADAVLSALTISENVNCAASVRALLTVADAMAVANSFGLASVLYERARQGAVKLGDLLSTAAASHNRATIALSHVRLACALGRKPEPLATNLLAELASAQRLEQYLQLETVNFPFAVWRARMAILQGDYSAAAKELDQVFSSERLLTSPLLRASLYADRAYCCLQRSQLEDSRKFIELALAGLDNSRPYLDDECVVLAYAKEIDDRLSGAAAAKSAEDRLEKSVAMLDAESEQIRNAFAAVLFKLDLSSAASIPEST